MIFKRLILFHFQTCQFCSPQNNQNDKEQEIGCEQICRLNQKIILFKFVGNLKKFRKKQPRIKFSYHELFVMFSANQSFLKDQGWSANGVQIGMSESVVLIINIERQQGLLNLKPQKGNNKYNLL